MSIRKLNCNQLKELIICDSTMDTFVREVIQKGISRIVIDYYISGINQEQLDKHSIYEDFIYSKVNDLMHSTRQEFIFFKVNFFRVAAEYFGKNPDLAEISITQEFN